MVKNNSVVFKGGKKGILIQLSETADFEVIRAVLSEKLKGATKFFGDAETPVVFSGRTLTDEQEAELLAVIQEYTRLTLMRPTSPEPAPVPVSPVHAPPSAEPGDDHPARFHHGGLRSGQSIRFAGSVIVNGDVNPGAEIVAGRNIVVLGALRGTAYAGQGGDASSFVSALSMHPIQLRIGNCVTAFPQEGRRTAKKTLNPVYAYIEDGRIIVAPLTD